MRKNFILVSGGAGYAAPGGTNNIPLISLTGSGTGAQCAISIDATTGAINSISNLTTGSGYQVGEVLTVDNSDVKVTRGAGFKLIVSTLSDNSS